MISTADVLFPAGDVTASLYPELSTEVLQSHVAVWITQGYLMNRVSALATAAAQDAAAKKYAEHRAFKGACIENAQNPAAADMKDQGSSQFEKDQRETICETAQRLWDEFVDLAPIVEPDSVAAGTRTTRHQFVW